MKNHSLRYRRGRSCRKRSPASIRPLCEISSAINPTAVGLIALEISHNGLILAGERFLQLLPRRYRREWFFIQDLAQALIGQCNHTPRAIETQVKCFEQFFRVEGKEGLRLLIARHRP